MEKTLLKVIKDRRTVLQNPYAYDEEIAEFEAAQANKKLLENPHAHNEIIERMASVVRCFDGLTISTAPSDTIKLSKDSAPRPQLAKHSEQEIGKLVRDLQIRMWRELQAEGVDNPLRALDPLVALQKIGYHAEIVENLGRYGSGSQVIEVAGLINSKEKSVLVSAGQQSPYYQNFTAAHELGHALMHEGMELHRDQPLDGSQNSPLERHEREANRFAVLFLMPEKLVRQIFQEIYGSVPFKLSDETEFALSSSSKSRKKLNFSSLRELSMHLSSIETYNGLQFVPLHKRFKVSNKTMAIRLEELGLIQFN